jgi:hypothetical protein
VKWCDDLKTKYLDNFWSDPDSNAETAYFPRHVWKFHLAKDGIGELSRCIGQGLCDRTLCQSVTRAPTRLTHLTTFCQY